MKDSLGDPPAGQFTERPSVCHAYFPDSLISYPLQSTIKFGRNEDCTCHTVVGAYSNLLLGREERTEEKIYRCVPP